MTTIEYFASIQLLPAKYDRRTRKLTFKPVTMELSTDQEYQFLHRRDFLDVTLNIAYDSDVEEHEV